MEGPKSAVVLDISSDEEADYGSGGGSDVDFKWIRKLLDDDDDENEEEGFKDGGDSDDSDDLVVVVGEVCPNHLKQSVKKPAGGVVTDFSEGGDDDDCVVLDGDPDKPTAVDKEKGELEDGYSNDSDDLVVVSEKGEVACRDFPHPRHLCAKYSFSSSRHEMHCDQCHCYVCDSVAPCLYWGTGVSSFDHCHATDKEAFWKSQRSSLRSVDVPMPIPVPEVHHIAISMRRPPMANQSSPWVPNVVQQGHVLRQFTVRPCSTPTNSVVPNVSRQVPRTGYVVPRSTFQTDLLSQYLADTSHHISLTDNRHNNSNMGPQRAKFKRAAGDALASGRSVLNPPSCLNYGSRLPTDSPPTPRLQGSHGRSSVTHAYRSSYLSNVGETADMLSPQTDPVFGNRFSSTMSPQIPSQQNRGTGNGNGMLLQPQMAVHQHTSPGSTNYMPQTSSHCHVDDLSVNSVPPRQLASSHSLSTGNIWASFVSAVRTTYQLDMDYDFMNTTPTPHQLTCFTKQNEGRTIGYSEPTQSQSFRQFEADTECLPFPLPNAGSSSMDPFLPYQSLEYSQPTIIPNSHDSLQQRNQTILEDVGSNVAVSDSFPVSCTTPNIHLSGYNSQLQHAEQTDYYSGNTNFYPQYPNPTDLATNDLEAWLSVDHSVPKALGVPVPLLNTPIPSPELASLDGGGLFID